MRRSRARGPGRTLVGMGVAIAAGVLGTFVRPAGADPLLTYPLKIKGHGVRVEMAATEEEKRTGLMFRRSLGENSGMIFVYENEGRWAMWMKNTYVPLSVAFIDRSGRILNIEDMQPLTEDTHQAAGPAKYALEMNQGWFAKRGIGKGDQVQGLEQHLRQPLVELRLSTRSGWRSATRRIGRGADRPAPRCVAASPRWGTARCGTCRRSPP